MPPKAPTALTVPTSDPLVPLPAQDLLKIKELKPQVIVVDVRGEEERSDGHVDGSIHLPFHEHFADGTASSTQIQDLVKSATGAAAAAQQPCYGDDNDSAKALVVFYCMYCKERGPRAARAFMDVATAQGAEKSGVRVGILVGGFQRLLNASGSDKGGVAGFKAESWVETPDGLVWKNDVPLWME